MVVFAEDFTDSLVLWEIASEFQDNSWEEEEEEEEEHIFLLDINPPEQQVNWTLPYNIRVPFLILLDIFLGTTEPSQLMKKFQHPPASSIATKTGIW